eukprot:9472791-Pyramimonas_sp.AAC.2
MARPADRGSPQVRGVPGGVGAHRHGPPDSDAPARDAHPASRPPGLALLPGVRTTGSTAHKYVQQHCTRS